MEYRIFIADAFTKRIFSGNPAAVFIYEKNLEEEMMKNIAMEMNLSETAFVNIYKETGKYNIRWFTPSGKEMGLCGHATLASSKILFDELKIEKNEIVFDSLSGDLKAVKTDDGIMLDFPKDEFIEFENNEFMKPVFKTMGIPEAIKCGYGVKTGKILIELDDENMLKSLKPDFNALKDIEKIGEREIKGIVVTSQSKNHYDFISRYFHPWVGVNEDPVTGSAHTLLADYWMKKTDKLEYKAYQASQRGGEIILKIKNDRVELYGDALITLRGTIEI